MKKGNRFLTGQDRGEDRWERLAKRMCHGKCKRLKRSKGVSTILQVRPDSLVINLEAEGHMMGARSERGKAKQRVGRSRREELQKEYRRSVLRCRDLLPLPL